MAQPRNILWIMVDQMRGDTLGYAGHPTVHTPCLDAFAERSVVFERTFAQCPLCTPSRALLFTGRYVHGHGSWTNGVPISREATLLPEYLRQNGYDTAIVGKLHQFPTHLDHGFNNKELHEERLDPAQSAYAAFLEKEGETGGFPGVQTEWHNRPVGICKMEEEHEETRWVADRTLSLLQERCRSDQPFFLYSSFLRPHSPFNPLERFARMYDDVTIDAPDFDLSDWDGQPIRVRKYAETKDFDQIPEDEWIQIRKHYYALCTQVDESIGIILDALERSTFAGHTLVVFASDHGEYMGDHGMHGKGHLWDSALHVPFILYDPAKPGEGRRYAGLTELIDIVPSILDLAGLDVPANIQGKSVVPSIHGGAGIHRDAVFAEMVTHTNIPNIYDLLDVFPEPYTVSIRTDDWKYIHYAAEAGELYDLKNDPGERRNRFGEEGLASITTDLRHRILDWMLTTNGFSAPDRENPYQTNYFPN
jgi:arylsulfatase